MLLSQIQKFSFADAAAFNPNSNKTLLAKGVSTFFINGRSAVNNEKRKLKNPSY